MSDYSWKERRVLVTGATGIVGSWLCEALIERGAYVVALVRDHDPQSRFYYERIAERCSVVSGDLVSYADTLRALNEHEIGTVFHLGAQTIVGSAERDPLGTFESNIRGTYMLLEAARQLPTLIKAFIVASSDKAYGDSPTLPYTEDMPLRGLHPYDVSKSCTDMLAQTYHHSYGLPVAIARCGNIYGGGDLNWSRIVPGTIRSILSGERPVLRGDGGNIRDYIYVRDVVDAYIDLAEHLETSSIAGNAYNFSPESRWSVLEIVEMVGKAMGVQPDPVILNKAKLEIRDQTLDSSKAKRELGWNSRWTLERGLAETVSWYREFLSSDLPKGLSR